MKKKAFVPMHARVLLLFWERVGGCHPQGKHRLGEEALGALMVFWVPRPSVLLGKAPDMLCGDVSPKGTVKHGSAYMLWIQSCHQHQKTGEPSMRGTDFGVRQSQLS